MQEIENLGFVTVDVSGQSWGGLNGLPRTVCSALESASSEQLGRRRIQQLDDHEVGVSDFARTAGRFLEIGVTQFFRGNVGFGLEIFVLLRHCPALLRL